MPMRPLVIDTHKHLLFLIRECISHGMTLSKQPSDPRAAAGVNANSHAIRSLLAEEWLPYPEHGDTHPVRLMDQWAVELGALKGDTWDGATYRDQDLTRRFEERIERICKPQFTFTERETTLLSDLDAAVRDLGCAELVEDGSCIHSDHMRQAGM